MKRGSYLAQSEETLFWGVNLTNFNMVLGIHWRVVDINGRRRLTFFPLRFVDLGVVGSVLTSSELTGLDFGLLSRCEEGGRMSAEPAGNLKRDY